MDYDDERGFVNDIVEALELHREEWSIRIVLWNVDGHYGHAHVDFWPTCLEHRWCGRAITPQWRNKDGSKQRTDSPFPENGYYNGPPDEGDLMPKALFEDMIRALFDIGQEFQPDSGANYWIQMIADPDNPEWLDFWEAFTRQLTKETP